MIQDNSMEYLNMDEIREILQHNLSLTDGIS